MDNSKEISAAKIRVIGVGGAGGNAIDNMIESGIQGVEFIAINTDKQDLDRSRTDVKVLLGEGLGAGADPEMARKEAKEAEIEIQKVLEGTDMLFITGGMGGGTGTGASPIIAQISKEMGILTVAIVTKPFNFEGFKRIKNAEEGIENLKKHVDSIIVVPNDKLFELPNADTTTLVSAFNEANGILRIGVKGISDLITTQGHINLDFADVKSIMKDSGIAMLGFGEGTGENKVGKATEQALNSPLLEKSIDGAKNLLVSITTGKEFGLMEINELFKIINEKAGNLDVNLQWGVVIEPELQDSIKVSIVATNFDEEYFQQKANGNNVSDKSNNESGKILTEEINEKTIFVPPFFDDDDDKNND